LENETIVSVRDLKFEYEGGIKALKSVSLKIKAGEYLAIVGGNGSGKTTLAKNLNGLLRPTGGEVEISGVSAKNLRVAELARYVGYAFQNPDHQLFCASVEKEVRFGPKNLGFPDSAISERATHAIEIMGLSDVSTKPPLSLTLGLRRKVSIASVIAMDPKVIILDEPTTGLDASEVRELMHNIDSLNKEGHTIILITHDMKLVAEHARRVVVMSDGRVVLDSDPRGAFSDLEILRDSKLEPPPVTLLAHRLSASGIPRDVISPEELVFHVLRKGQVG